jgi:Zn-dependent peptidase ImmA (M78 family)
MEVPIDTIERVRALMPVSTLTMLARPLAEVEARIIAERQANRLRKLLGISTSPAEVEVELVLELPDIELEVVPDLPLSARTDWNRQRQQWVITMNQDDSLWRSRATLAHELKHILDDPFRELLYPEWPRDSQALPPVQAERICDYFAGCVLVPKGWLLSAWQHGVQEAADLASLFNVSDALIRVRLKQVGLATRTIGEGPAGYSRRAPRRHSQFVRRVARRLAVNQARAPQLTS